MNAQSEYVILHPRIVRYAHWCWALGVIILIGSGWQIYNQEPIFAFFTFPSWATIGLGSYESAELLQVQDSTVMMLSDMSTLGANVRKTHRVYRTLL